jgi:uncharacterized protein (DUF2164 family)
LKEKQDALKLVADGAKIHNDYLRSTLNDRYSNQSFNAARAAYVRKLDEALSEVARLKLDETLKVSERVSDLNLEDAVDLLHAVEDHIRNLRQHKRRPDFL